MEAFSLLAFILLLSVVYYLMSRYLAKNCCPECMIDGFMRKM